MKRNIDVVLSRCRGGMRLGMYLESRMSTNSLSKQEQYNNYRSSCINKISMFVKVHLVLIDSQMVVLIILTLILKISPQSLSDFALILCV
jgi:hypothetical protein